MHKKIINIKGMHCRSCELMIEDELLQIPAVKKANVNYTKGTAEVFHKKNLNMQEVEKAVRNAGYGLGEDKKDWISKNAGDYKEMGLAVLIAAGLFIVAGKTGILNISTNNANGYGNLGWVFLIGLTAGVSTCMALTGGLVLGAAAKFAEQHPEASTTEKFIPHLWFNAGRVGSYIILGGLIGALGSVLSISTSIVGLLTIGVGLVMLVLGIQLTEIFPVLGRISITLPAGVAKALGIGNLKNNEYSHKGAILAGAMTFFVPCGFTQAIQLYAVSTGSPITGAMALGTFALGTAPGLLSVGGLTAAIKGKAARIFFKTAGIAVTLLAVISISNGLNLAGLNKAPAEKAAMGETENGVQIIRMRQTAGGYAPNSFTVQKGKPVRWIINSENNYTCAASIASAKLKIRKLLTQGENVIEFTPNETGVIPFSCSMGMYRGSFTVI